MALQVDMTSLPGQGIMNAVEDTRRTQEARRLQSRKEAVKRLSTTPVHQENPKTFWGASH